MSDIRKITVEEFFSHKDSHDLLEAYGDECRLAGMPPINPDIDMYLLMENAGFLSVFGAFNGDEMEGFLVVLVSRNPHYSNNIGTIESIFVNKEKRSSGAGLALINKAKAQAIDSGAVGIFISAPAYGVFTKVMEGLGARHTNNVFFWSFIE